LFNMLLDSWSQWPCSLRHKSATAHLLGLHVCIPKRAWMSVSRGCHVLSGRGLCSGLIISPEGSFQVWYVWVWSWSLDNEEAPVH
jgi:hypothetical protein